MHRLASQRNRFLRKATQTERERFWQLSKGDRPNQSISAGPMGTQ